MTTKRESAGQPTFSHLGKASESPTEYSPELLESISRQVQREQIGLPNGHWPHFGVDVWVAHELTWLDGSGAPRIALVRLEIPCNSPNIVESKSVKLYLQSFTETRFEQDADVQASIGKDISTVCGADVNAELLDIGHDFRKGFFVLDESIDRLEIPTPPTQPDSSSLSSKSAGKIGVRARHTHAFRCVCPVTGQPDFATVLVEYCGRPMVDSGLRTYLMGYRNHAGFHETTIEQIFIDIETGCEPKLLCVSGLFLRRGGIDISVFRANSSEFDSNRRSPRQ